MREGEPSVTAQHVAAHRLGFARAPTEYGDPEADQLLARDVAQGARATSPMARYLAARTAFFDRVVVGAIDEGLTQLVAVGAGYDGRSLRYAKSGISWFEVDHPDTQRDKLERLERLRIDASGITFVPLDLRDADLAVRLGTAGCDPVVRTLFICEGVAAYLEDAVVAELLVALRASGPDRSLLAISLSVAAATPGLAERRARFERAVEEIGEPARSTLTATRAGPLFARAGWRQVEAGHGLDHAGFVRCEAS